MIKALARRPGFTARTHRGVVLMIEKDQVVIFTSSGFQ